ncbi:MAG: class I adenylate-forming enzyme family protein [Saccharolobus sp.]|uniref:Long-chain-fatty-acid--CoA ligase n=2 Tax=Saccharolobus TaxID=2100760 RepID=A0A8F5BRV1_SACSH|nr:class I adenylate-forming enzyme family protein [Saccharolobus shibatae]MCH4814551.1 acyl--CoA ligase [Saccharolobus shibatae]QXJ30175.1 Long-chain-fatty-acid--CoA ligase [Saccharolobus shibatae B12]
MIKKETVSLATLLYKWYKETPSKTFLIDKNQSITYEQAAREVAYVASNISPGDTVVHMMTNSLQSVINYLAIYWAGGKVVAVDPLTSAEDLKFILEDSIPDLIITDEEIYKREYDVLKSYKVIVNKKGKDIFTKPYEYREDEVGLIYYYAGIAGRTMQVLHSASRVELNSATLYNAINLKEIRGILTVPIAHVLGNSVLGVILEAGGTLYVMGKFNVDEAIESINRYNINYLSTVPTVYDYLNNEEKKKLDSLELCVSSAAPLFPSTVNTFKSKYGKDIVQQYGFTEGLIITFQPKELAGVISIGKPLPGVEIKIVDNEGKENNEGELWVKAPWLMLGYKDREETARAFNKGWLRTGDLVRIDEKGLLYFRGIKKRMLKFKGYPIFPRDLEEILKTHPLVEDVKVVGEDAGNLGQQPVALVKVKELKTGIEDELLNYVNSRVAFYKRLKKVYVVDRIERN